MSDHIVIQSSTKAEQERKIDEFLLEGKPHKDFPLILPADGRTYRYMHRGITIRVWFKENSEVYDSCVELEK